jgi:hypothetical protein
MQEQENQHNIEDISASKSAKLLNMLMTIPVAGRLLVWLFFGTPLARDSTGPM